MYHLYLREVGEVELLSRNEEIELARRVRQGDEQARERMIKANLRLVVKIAHDFGGQGLPLLDLISEGNIGLMKAVDRYDLSYGAKFSTYAAWWIKQYLRRALANQLRTVRLPVHVQDRLLQIKRAATKLHELLGREPTDAEIGDELGMPEAKVGELRGVAVWPLSLEESLGSDVSEVIADVIADEHAPAPWEKLDEAVSSDFVQEIFQELNPREKTVLRYRFGLDGDGKRSLEHIAVKIGLTREAVRLIQNRALRKLRQRMTSLEVASWAA